MDYNNIRLDKVSAVPLYRQLANQIKTAAASGELAAGTKLPPIRKLAAELAVSAVTVTQAYELLAAEEVTGGQVGRGTYILPPKPTSISTISEANNNNSYKTPTQNQFSWLSGLRVTARAPRSTEMAQVVQRAVQRWGNPATLINFSSGNPDQNLFAMGRWRQAMAQAGRELEQETQQNGGLFLQYGSVLGDEPLRLFLAGYFGKFGFQPQPDEIMLTTGSQQSLDLLARLFIEPGDPVFVENFSYVAALDIFEQSQVNWRLVPFDENGMQVDVLERLLERPQSRPRLVYTVPTAHSPTGLTLAIARRHKLIELAERYNLILIEDDVANELYYEGDETAPTLASLDRAGRVIYLKSFSKTIFPAVRLGCIVAAAPLLAYIAQGKQLFDRATSVPLARAVLNHINTRAYEQELKNNRVIYRQRRDVLLEGLERELKGLGCRWTVPKAGFSMLLTLPPELNEGQLVEEVMAHGLIVTPGQLFSPTFGSQPGNSVRLTLGDKSPEQLLEGTRRLGQAVQNLLRNNPRPPQTSLNFIAAV